MSSSRTCGHVRANGKLCEGPALRDSNLCYWHHKARQRRRHRHDARGPVVLPLLEDGNAIQVSVQEVLHALLDGRLDNRKAGLLLYGLQVATSNLHRLEANPSPYYDQITSIGDEEELDNDELDSEEAEDDEEDPEESEDNDEAQGDEEEGDNTENADETSEDVAEDRYAENDEGDASDGDADTDDDEANQDEAHSDTAEDAHGVAPPSPAAGPGGCCSATIDGGPVAGKAMNQLITQSSAPQAQCLLAPYLLCEDRGELLGPVP